MEFVRSWREKNKCELNECLVSLLNSYRWPDLTDTFLILNFASCTSWRSFCCSQTSPVANANASAVLSMHVQQEQKQHHANWTVWQTVRGRKQEEADDRQTASVASKGKPLFYSPAISNDNTVLTWLNCVNVKWILITSRVKSSAVWYWNESSDWFKAFFHALFTCSLPTNSSKFLNINL